MLEAISAEYEIAFERCMNELSNVLIRQKNRMDWRIAKTRICVKTFLLNRNAMAWSNTSGNKYDCGGNTQSEKCLPSRIIFLNNEGKNNTSALKNNPRSIAPF
jgi:hypothetical protein